MNADIIMYAVYYELCSYDCLILHSPPLYRSPFHDDLDKNLYHYLTHFFVYLNSHRTNQLDCFLIVNCLFEC